MAIMEPYDSIWHHMAVYVTIWQYMAPYSSIWHHMTVYGSIWQYMAPMAGMAAYGTCGSHMITHLCV